MAEYASLKEPRSNWFRDSECRWFPAVGTLCSRLGANYLHSTELHLFAPIFRDCITQPVPNFTPPQPINKQKKASWLIVMWAKDFRFFLFPFIKLQFCLYRSHTWRVWDQKQKWTRTCKLCCWFLTQYNIHLRLDQVTLNLFLVTLP